MTTHTHTKSKVELVAGAGSPQQSSPVLSVFCFFVYVIVEI